MEAAAKIAKEEYAAKHGVEISEIGAFFISPCAAKMTAVKAPIGQENSSRQYTYDKVKKLVERQKEKYGWEFLFLGANIDAIAEAGKFGIRADRAVNYHSDKQGTAVNYRVLSETVSKVRCCSAAAMDAVLSSNWQKEIEEDYAGRN